MRQPFAIYGENFAPGAKIILRDLAQHQDFDHRLSSSLSSTQIVLNPTFTTDQHLWSVEVINADNQSTGQVQFQVIAPAGADSTTYLPFFPREELQRLVERRRSLETSACSSEQERGTGPAPIIKWVAPNPVVGSHFPTRFTISGANFRSGANVILRDLTAEIADFQPIDHQISIFFSSTDIVLNPSFTTDQLWSVEVINCDHQSTGEFRFQVLAPP